MLTHKVNFAEFTDVLTPQQLRLLSYYNALSPFRRGALLERAKVLYEEQTLLDEKKQQAEDL